MVVANLMSPKFRTGWSINFFIRSSTWLASLSRWGVLLYNLHWLNKFNFYPVRIMYYLLAKTGQPTTQDFPRRLKHHRSRRNFSHKYSLRNFEILRQRKTFSSHSSRDSVRQYKRIAWGSRLSFFISF